MQMDTQIYIEFDPKIPGDTVIALHKLQECIRELRSWMTVNKLKLNEEKTEFFIAASTHNMNYLNNVSLDVCGTQIKPSHFFRNLGVYFDTNNYDYVKSCLLSYTLLEFQSTQYWTHTSLHR